MLYQFANNGKLSGRADGNVYMRNGRIRGMTVPSLVQNSFTSAARSALSSFSSGWNALTADQRASWNGATGFTTTDRFGMPVPLVGKNLYVALNQNLQNAGGSPILIAPSAGSVLPPTFATVDADASAHTVEVNFLPDPVPAGVGWLVFATGLKSAGTSRPGDSQFRLVTTMAAAQTAPFAMGTAYEARFGPLIAGKKIFVKIVPVNITTGQKGPGIIIDNEVTT